MGNSKPSSYPAYVLITEAALHTPIDLAMAAYMEKGTEWGGTLYGYLLRDPGRGVVPVITHAFGGVCKATPYSCDILPASWDRAEVELGHAGRGDLVNLGVWHSHPTFTVFMSKDDDEAFWGAAHADYFVSFIIDPWSNDYRFYAKTGPAAVAHINGYLISERIRQIIETSLTESVR